MSGLPVPGRERRQLTDGWELARTQPGARSDAGGLGGLTWQPAAVPGTVAGAVGDASSPGLDVDGYDWWFRTSFAAAPAGHGEEVVLALEGIATVAEVYLNGRRVLQSESMFAAHEVQVGALLAGDNALAICCRALAPLLEQRRRPRARWRTKLVSEGNLRFHRTMLLGRAPGFAPGPAVAGPWRPVALERRRGLVADDVRLRATVDGDDGTLGCRAQLRTPDGAELPDRIAVTVAIGPEAHAGELIVTEDGVASGTVTVPGARRWWPHTHGDPVLYTVTVGGADAPLHVARVGFRTLEPASDLLADGPELRINGTRVFARGAVWTPVSQRAPHAPAGELRRILGHARAAGMNMLRVPGIGAYENDAFYDLCDELGILVWQDFMFANLDYPEGDPAFMAVVEREAREVLARLGFRPSLAVLCGGSEVAQQVAMLGLDPALAEGPLYGELLPAAVRGAEVDAPYVPSAPWGGDLPFRTDRGVANYFGVGAYLRPLQDARRAEVRFAAECLAFANVPDEAALADLDAPGGLVTNDPAWKAGVPRDVGAGWDFDDVRDHYLRLLFGTDPVALRSVDPERYLELSRAVGGEVMAETFGEWRRTQSPCAGALVLWLKDLRPGAGWGVLDHRGAPKVAYHHLRRALAPVAVWTTDEGLGGVAIHVANDRPEALAARLRVALYRDHRRLVQEAETPLELGPHGQASLNLEEIVGRFVDVTWAYRFGPPAQDLVVVTLERPGADEPEMLSQAFRFPEGTGRPLTPRPADELGLDATLRELPDGDWAVSVQSAGFAYGVRVAVPGWQLSDDAFCVEPGHERVIRLTPAGDDAGDPVGTLTALNLTGRVRI